MSERMAIFNHRAGAFLSCTTSSMLEAINAARSLDHGGEIVVYQSARFEELQREQAERHRNQLKQQGTKL